MRIPYTFIIGVLTTRKQEGLRIIQLLKVTVIFYEVLSFIDLFSQNSDG